MKDVETERKKMVHQGRNVKIVRESRGLYQKDLGYKINKEQSEISRLESQEIIEEDILKQISLALNVPEDFLRNFDLNGHLKTYYNYSGDAANATFADNSQGTVNQQTQGEQENIVNNNYPLDEYRELTARALKMQDAYHQKEIRLIAEKHELDKENALLKQQIEFLKGNK